jgi:aminoglycoside 6'-N-acetyltransferase
VVENVSLVGDRVVLRPTVAADRPSLVAIRATEAVRSRWRGDDLESEFDEGLDDGQVVQLTIETLSGEIVGMIQFGEENEPDYRHASIDVYVDPAVHRRGYASDAIRTLVDYLFDVRGHHRLTIDPAADNAPAIKCYGSVGFRPVGLMRRYERQRDGTWADGLLMEMLASDRTGDGQADALESVVAFELGLLDPRVRGDRDALERFFHPDFFEVGVSGRRWSRDEIVRELVASPDPAPVEVTEMEARWVSADVMVVTYQTICAEWTILRTSTWVRVDDSWKIRFHQATPTTS